MNRNKKYYSLSCFLIIFFLTKFIYAQEIKNVGIVKTNNKIFLNIKLDRNIPSEIYDYLYNGVKITIVYKIDLYKKNPFYLLFDSQITNIECKKSVEYNIWEKAYYFEEKNIRTKVMEKNEINRKLIELSDIFLVDTRRLKKDEDYYIMVQASLESIKLFPPLSWIFDLVSVRGFKTSWKQKILK